MKAPAIVDVDDRATWPRHVADYVKKLATRLRGTTEFTSDLAVPIEDREAFLRMFDGYMVRGYHCTRLLDHERAMILDQGLRTLSDELVMSRIHAAHSAGAISDVEREHFERGHVFADPAWKEQRAHREAQLCLIFSRRIFEHEADGLVPFLTTWGGEAIYFPLDRDHGERLRSLGRPSVVVARVDIAASLGRDRPVPPLDRTFVGVELGLADAGCEMFHRAPIAPDHIEAIWHPGDREYDRHIRLPRV